MKKLSNYLDNKKVILAILLIVSILTLLICSKNSPLYPYNDWVDGNAFFTMGKGMFNGKVPYKDLFEQKWNILERETRQLAIDKDKFEREKLIYKDKVYREARRSMSNAENVKIFFKGVEDTTSLKKRYKALLKIYHPDNMHGDKELLQAINTEYERLSRFYLGT